ncbi:hypothetical protein ACJJTC_004079 [Scirpophaga incertulas]
MFYLITLMLYINFIDDWSDFGFRIRKLFQNDIPFIHTIGNFNRGRMVKWILSNETVNKFAQDIDKAILPKETFVNLIVYMQNFSITMKDSDICISRITYNSEVLDVNKFRPCRRDPHCEHCIRSDPSVAYSLSHRLLNLQLRLGLKRCYVKSVEEDEALFDKLCAQMYRETVYIARRGFFARDLFLEHIALCATAGYEEFYRRHWFQKATNWLTKNGCMSEFRNFNINRTKELIKYAGNDRKMKERFVRIKCELLNIECDEHATDVLLIVLAHAIRHAARFMNKV